MDNDAQRAYVKIRYQLGDKALDIYHQLLATQGTSSVSHRTVKRWCKALADQSFTDQKKSRPGRPVETSSPENVARLKSYVTKKPRTTVREIEEDLCLPQTTVHRILTVHLDLRNVFSVWVPHELSSSNQQQRVVCCKDLLKLFREHPMAFIGSHYLVQDESWIAWDHQERRRVWIGKQEPKPTTARAKLTNRKTMLVIALTCKPKRFTVTLVPQGDTMDSKSTIQFLKDTRKRFSQLRRDPLRLKDAVLQWDNARPHSSRETIAFLDDLGIKRIKQSPYSPDLNLCDRYLFRKIKSDLKGVPMRGPDDVKVAVRQCLDRISEEDLLKELEKLRKHCEEVVRLGGVYTSEI